MEQNNKKTELLLPLLLLGLLAAFLVSLCLGSSLMKPSEVFHGLFSSDSSTAVRIVKYVRLPRSLSALAVGAALGASGAVIQTVLNNPLAAPHIIGVNSGAGLMAALCCGIFPGAILLQPLAAFLGALLGVLLVLFIGEKTGAASVSLILAGVAVSALFSAGIDVILTLFPEALSGYTDFRIGGFSAAQLERLLPAAAVMLAGFALTLSLAGDMELLALGEPAARSLGVPVKRSRLLLLLGASAMAGAAISVAGLIGFVGLIVPHFTRGRVRGRGSLLLVSSALSGGILLCLCDALARTAFAPYELPVGIVLAFLGAPLFLWILYREKGGRHAGA